MPRDSFMTKVDARLASSFADNAANASGRTFAEEALPAIQRLGAIARAYARDLQQRGLAFEAANQSLALEVSFAGRTGNWSFTLGEHSDAPGQLAFLTGSPPYTRELDPQFWIPSEITNACFEGKLEEFIDKVMDAELLAR